MIVAIVPTTKVADDSSAGNGQGHADAKLFQDKVLQELYLLNTYMRELLKVVTVSKG